MDHEYAFDAKRLQRAFASKTVVADYLRTTYALAAEKSNDPRTQNGAIIVSDRGVIVGAGVNAFPSNVLVTPERLVSPEKYRWMEHAERNAIFDLLPIDIVLFDATMYCPWFACCDCARAIIQSGIRKVVGHKQIFDKYGVGPWTESIEVGNQMFREAGVETELYDGSIGGVSILFNGERWEP